VSKKNFQKAAKLKITLITPLKENQKTLRKQVIFGCKRQRPVKVHRDSVTKEHGRIEGRAYELYPATPMLDKWEEWGIKRVVKVTRYRHEIGEKPTIEEVYYVSNGRLTLRKFAKYIRKHWYVENKLNYVKDVTFREDSSIKRVHPHNFSALIDISLNILRKHWEKNIRSTRYSCAWNFEKALELCGIEQD
jgi:predicted transposase YbfD/YdcC